MSRFLAAGSTVIICGRREALLDEIKAQQPTIIPRKCDVADPTQRVALRDWVVENHPECNILINNAGAGVLKNQGSYGDRVPEGLGDHA